MYLVLEVLPHEKITCNVTMRLCRVFGPSWQGTALLSTPITGAPIGNWAAGPQHTDEQLQRFRVSTTVLLGEHSTRHPAAAVHERLTNGNIHSEVVQGAGHALVLERPDLWSAAVLLG